MASPFLGSLHNKYLVLINQTFFFGHLIFNWDPLFIFGMTCCYAFHWLPKIKFQKLLLWFLIGFLGHVHWVVLKVLSLIELKICISSVGTITFIRGQHLMSLALRSILLILSTDSTSYRRTNLSVLVKEGVHTSSV